MQMTIEINKTVTDAIILNFEEIRGRSLKLWRESPTEFYHWRPDVKAFSIAELIRHVLETENTYHAIVNQKGDPLDFVSPWKDIPLMSLEEELVFAAPFRTKFFQTIKSFSLDDLNSIRIVRKDRRTRSLGDFLNRCAYHEAIHAGQFLSYFRVLGLDRPNIWD